MADCIGLIIENRRGYTESSSQGFITSKNRFVDRYEGYKLQIEAGIPSAFGGYRGKDYIVRIYIKRRELKCH